MLPETPPRIAPPVCAVDNHPVSLPPARKRVRKSATSEGPAPFPPSVATSGAAASDPLTSVDADVGANIASQANCSAQSPRSYDIGYGKPPVSTRFQPGQSGNPKGKPKGAKGLNTIVRETLGGKIAVRTPDGSKQISKIEAVLQKTLERALKGDSRAQFELMKLWKSAVPDGPHGEPPESQDEDLSAADLAILAVYEAQLAHKMGGRP